MLSATAITADILSGIEGVRHAFFTRQGGVSDGIYASLNGGLGSGDSKEAVLENRRRMAATLGVAPEALVSLHQIHSPDILTLEAPFSMNERPKADGMVTRTKGIALGVLSADCGPVLFADREARVIGACHSGWKGALAGVVEATIAAMEAIGATRKNIAVAVGPTIGPKSYEVGASFRDTFLAAELANARFFKEAAREGHAMFDLPGFIVSRAQRADAGTVVDLGLDTYADPERFYSYRRTTHRGEPDYGRLVSAIALV